MLSNICRHHKRRLKTDDEFRILSTPQVLTTDNEEAMHHGGGKPALIRPVQPPILPAGHLSLLNTGMWVKY